MDSDFWTARLAAAKRQFTLQHRHNSSQLDRVSIDDYEVEDDVVRPDFPCPYCYEDYDIASLCSHLEDEHSGESKVTRELANPSYELLEYSCEYVLWSTRFVLFALLKLHGTCLVTSPCNMVIYSRYPFKTKIFHYRRRRLRRVGIPNSQALSLLGRDLEAHLQVLLGGGGYRSSNANASNAVNDPFISSLILNFPTSEAEEISKSVISSTEDTSKKNAASAHSWKPSFDPSLSYEEREEKMRQATGRAVFMQDLLISTLWRD
ncbi:Drought induced 19 protein type, zinc-binding domain [Dillenia turbinata]|uniref:Drought induced 19 protein type, zinc-binding domain n=1 Tax=Dillenia turbinata TaxID=194707 RepID=A0AAN8UVM8_9MAGN